MVINAFVKILILAAVLAALTFVYSIFETQPSKVISYFIITLILSFTIGLVLLFIIMILKVKRAFIKDPFKVILSLVLLIGLSKILVAFASKTTATNLEDNRSVLAAPYVYENAEYGVSFQYSDNWTRKNTTKTSTLALLYETSGSQATCNLSVIRQDMHRIEDYDEGYFRKTFPNFGTPLDNVMVKFLDLNGKKVSWMTADVMIQGDSDALPARFSVTTGLHKGHRFMLVLVVPKSNTINLEDDWTELSTSLTFK